MKMRFVTEALMLGVIISISACSKDDNTAYIRQAEFEIYANVPQTKTLNDNMSTKWADNDGIIVYHAVAGSTTYVKDGKFTLENTDKGKFTGTLKEELEESSNYDWYVFYPFNSNHKPNQSYSQPIGCAYNAAQTQMGNNSMAHLAGSNFPLYGSAKSVSATDYPHISMRNVASLIEYKVKNELGKSITVKSIIFTSPENVVGRYRVNYLEDEATTTPYSASMVSKTATLNITDGAEIATGNEALFYVGINPSIVVAGSTLSVVVNVTDGTNEESQQFDLVVDSDIKFASGSIKTFELKFTKSF